ncbi:MAG: hypothetical protein ACYDD6_06480 [Acidimicrobiales bacterium]
MGVGQHLMRALNLTDLDVVADGFPHDAFARSATRGAGLVARATAHAPDGIEFWVLSCQTEVLAQRPAPTFPCR